MGIRHIDVVGLLMLGLMPGMGPQVVLGPERSRAYRKMHSNPPGTKARIRARRKMERQRRGR